MPTIIPESQTEGKGPQAASGIVTKFNNDDQAAQDLVKVLHKKTPVGITKSSGDYLWDPLIEPIVLLTLTGNAGLNGNPVSGNVNDGETFHIIVQQDATGGHTLTPNGTRTFTANNLSMDIATGANEVSLLRAVAFQGRLMIETVIAPLKDTDGGFGFWPTAI